MNSMTVSGKFFITNMALIFTRPQQTNGQSNTNTGNTTTQSMKQSSRANIQSGSTDKS